MERPRRQGRRSEVVPPEDTTMKDEVDEDQEAVYNIWNSRRQMS